jgi:hypothetical protein
MGVLTGSSGGGGGGRGGVVLLSVSVVLFLFGGAGLAASASAAIRRNFNNYITTLVEYFNALRVPADSLANMLRTEDTIPRLPRAVAELTRFRTGGVSLFGKGLRVSAGLSDVDFFIGGGCGALLVDNRSGLSCWFDGLVLMDPVVL